MEDLRSLAKLINDSLQQIDESCVRRGVTFPSLEDPSVSTNDKVYDDPVVKLAASHIVGAAAHLIAIARPPGESVVVHSQQVRHHEALERATLFSHFCRVICRLLCVSLSVDTSWRSSDPMAVQ